MTETDTVVLQRNRRSERHTQAGAKAPKKPSGKRPQGSFPVRTVIVLALLLLIAILALGITRGNRKRLEQERREEAAAYERLVARHTVAYRDWIEKYAAENAIHPAYVAAVILRESSYDPMAESRVGARGLMQLMPDTFELVRRNLGDDGAVFDDMYDPEKNIRYGCWYLGYLSRIFNGDPVEMACAYHAGPNNVKLWRMNYAQDAAGLQLDEIPMKDTRDYAGKVVNAYAIYFQHYYPDAQ